MSDVPPEIISYILSRLPIKSLLRFRCVSKPFCVLIDSPDFIKLHLHHSLNSNSRRSIITIGSRLYSIDFDLLDKPNLLNFPGTQVLGSCNGLLCLLSDDDNVFLCNPWTRKLKKLPVSDFKFPGNPSTVAVCQTVTYDLGYDHVNDDYKVLRIALFYNEVVNEVKVYSLKSNSWQKIKSFPYCLLARGTSVLVSGRLHWAVTLRHNMEDVIMSTAEVENANIGLSDNIKIASFDLLTEEYHLVPQPRYSNKIFFINVGELGGKLCVHCNYFMRYTDVWVMNRYGVTDSWTKLLSVSEHLDVTKLEYLRAFAYSKDEKQVLFEKKGGKLLWFDLELKTLKLIPGFSMHTSLTQVSLS